MPSKKDILDLYFVDARHKLIDVAAFLDRVDRHDGNADFRLDGLHDALHALQNPGKLTRAQAVLEALSDHSRAPIPKATIQGAFGACPKTTSTGETSP